LIQDETPREERVPRETAHPNGVTGIGTVTVAVWDVPPVARWYAEVLRRPGRDLERSEVDAAGVRFTVGSHTLAFVAPRGGPGPSASGRTLRTRRSCSM